MHAPAVALAWEIWRRHRPRVIAVVGLVLGFALIYPILCASAGFNPAGSDPLDEIAKMAADWNRGGPATLLRILNILFFSFLVCGPWFAMIATLLLVMWMFSYIELDPKTKAPTFPGRLFTLPISTPFLSWLLVLSGMASIVVLYGCWIYFVRLPHLEMFETYRSCFGWMTMLALAQGLLWALDGWPNTRMVLLMAVFLCFMSSPAQRQIFQSPYLLPPLFLLGVALARVGLQKVRHGQFQAWPAPLSWATRRADSAIKSARRFASPTQAQMWFERRRILRPISLYAVGLTFAPVAIFLGIRCVVGRSLQNDDLSVFVCLLMGVPLFVHYIFAIISPKADLPYLMNLPMTNGQIMMSKLKAAAISTVVSWGFVLAALCAMPLLGDFSGILRGTSIPLEGWVVIVIGLMFLTWRFIAVSLGFVLSGNRRLAEIPVWIFALLVMGGVMLVGLAQGGALQNSFYRLLPFLLAGLVALKFLLSFLAFRLSLKRRLLSQSALVGYLLIWFLIVALFLVLLQVMDAAFPLVPNAMLPLRLGIVLLVPLARIGFCPIAISWNRHS